MARVKLGVLISGQGSNLQALIDATRTGGYPAEIALVISNRADAPGLARAVAAGVPALAISSAGKSREAFDAEVQAALDAAGVELVALAGFLRVLTDAFVARWLGRMINIHPSLLPAFRGLHAHERALEAGVRIAGCTAHFVVPELDAGPIVMQAAVPVAIDDTPQTLAARIRRAEHRCIVEAVRGVASGEVRLIDGRVVQPRAAISDTILYSPAPF